MHIFLCLRNFLYSVINFTGMIFLGYRSRYYYNPLHLSDTNCNSSLVVRPDPAVALRDAFDFASTNRIRRHASQAKESWCNVCV